jgi:hypothetical protein
LVIHPPADFGAKLLRVECGNQSKVYSVASNLNRQHCLPMNKRASGFAGDENLIDGCEIFVHDTEELYMFDISWEDLS